MKRFFTMSALLVAVHAMTGSTAPPDSQPAATQPSASQPEARVIKPFDGVLVRLDPVRGNQVEVQAVTCLEEGWLEQVACMPQTREHESLVVMRVKPSHVHAALILAEFQAGAPGRWTYENKTFGAVDPTGEKIEIDVRYTDERGVQQEHSVRKWMRSPDDAARQPDQPWVFGGSRFAANPQSMGPGEHYVADQTGSIIGVVTFGDEVVGYGRVLADQDAVQDPAWEANPDTMPPPGTAVTVILRKFKP